MSEQSLLFDISDDGVARITLNRPDIHNAFNDELISRLEAAIAEVRGNGQVRAVLLGAAGQSFSAGADLNHMKRTAGYSRADNLADAKVMAELLHAIHTLDKPVVARVQGSAYGGGLGLIAASDIAISADSAKFMLSEVRLGLIPAVISPYVIGAIGARQARRYFLTGERFDAAEARRIGLVHAVVSGESLDATVNALLADLAKCGPSAVAAAKALVADVAGREIDAAVRDDTAARIADLRAGAEGREGVAAFLDKRRPAWYRD